MEPTEQREHDTDWRDTCYGDEWKDNIAMQR